MVDPIEKCHVKGCSERTVIGFHSFENDKVVSRHYCEKHKNKLKTGMMDQDGKPTEKAKNKSR